MYCGNSLFHTLYCEYNHHIDKTRRVTAKQRGCMDREDIYPNPATASELLQESAALIKQRGVERDAEGGERSMKRTVDSFNAMTGHKLTEEDGWLFMMMLKLSRSRAGKIQPDDYKDLISYSALLSECVLKETK